MKQDIKDLDPVEIKVLTNASMEVLKKNNQKGGASSSSSSSSVSSSSSSDSDSSSDGKLAVNHREKRVIKQKVCKDFIYDKLNKLKVEA